MKQSTKRNLARWIVALALAALSALIGNKHLNSNKNYGSAPPSVTGGGRPIDGDSLYVGSHEVRLKGIDAPEGRQTCTRDGREWDCGNAARDELRRLIGGNTVDCRIADRDQHGRLLGYCSAAGNDLNAGMVGAGLAVAYGGYGTEENSARSARRGLWAGEFQRPRDWRDAHGIGH